MPEAFLDRRSALTSWLLFGSIFASLGSGIFHITPLIAGMLQVVVAFLLLQRVSSWVRMQGLVLVLAGAGALFYTGSDLYGILDALSRNQQNLAMLAAVGFLRMVSLATTSEELPRGRPALWQTLFGVHWLGSVVNISSIVLFGDRMASATGTLAPNQAMVLARGYALAALWSPFWVGREVAFSQAPGAHFSVMLLFGLPLAHLLMVLMIVFLGRRMREGRFEFEGYPFQPSTLRGPLVLTVVVLTAHWCIPGLPIAGLVTLFAPLYALFACRRNEPFRHAAEYIRRDLPRMVPEVVLFVSAGVFGAGFTALVSSHPLPLSFLMQSEVVAVASGLVVILLLGAAGIHPVASITAVAAVLGNAGLSPDLMALSFLMGWALGVIISPTSGLNLLIGGRFGISITSVYRMHGAFVIWAFVISCGFLYLLAKFG